ncbi:MAG: GNAT family N-acetyltransferase [Kiritimatiellae bacterium]|nr:GNAT family N-acetyltransferase [Kiritimatiellia bacterium]
MKPPRIIKTRRLILRPPKMADARAIFETYATDPVVTQYLVWKPHKNIRETRAFLSDARKSWRNDTEYIWAMTLKKTGQVVGGIGLIPGGSRMELGYVLAQPLWGRGLTTEAGRAVLAWAMKKKNVYRVWATCDVDNKASARVLEKLGMKREGVLRKWMLRPAFGRVPRDCFCYSIVKDEEVGREKTRNPRRGREQ